MTHAQTMKPDAQMPDITAFTGDDLRALVRTWRSWNSYTSTRHTYTAGIERPSWELEAGNLLRLRLHVDLQRSPQRVRDRALALRFARHFRELRFFSPCQSLCHDGEFRGEQLDPGLGLVRRDRCRHERTGRTRLLCAPASR